MGQSILFDGLERREVYDVLCCFGSIIKKYEAGETVAHFPSAESSERAVGIIISGNARLVSYDSEGEMYLSALYEGEGVFGSMFISATDEECFYIEALDTVEVAYTEFERISEFCENVCSMHVRFSRNLYRLIVSQSKRDSLRLAVLSKKTLREKLLSYFSFCASECGSYDFNIKISLTELSKYLCVDRSAMMRELKRLKDDGVIYAKGSHIRMLNP